MNDARDGKKSLESGIGPCCICQYSLTPSWFNEFQLRHIGSTEYCICSAYEEFIYKSSSVDSHASLSIGVQELTKEAFDKLLLDAIDDAFSTLGDSARQSIYFHLESKFKIAKKEVPEHLEDFDEGLAKIFGPGSRFLEILIIKNLYEKTGQRLEWDENKEFVLVDYVKAVKHGFHG